MISQKNHLITVIDPVQIFWYTEIAQYAEFLKAEKDPCA